MIYSHENERLSKALNSRWVLPLRLTLCLVKINETGNDHALRIDIIQPLPCRCKDLLVSLIERFHVTSRPP